MRRKKKRKKTATKTKNPRKTRKAKPPSNFTDGAAGFRYPAASLFKLLHWQILDWEYRCQRRNVELRFALGRPKRSFDRPHVYAQVPSHRRPSVERFRIHVEGMVRSAGWPHGFFEVGRRGGPGRRRWAKDLLEASAEGENN